MGLSTGTQSQKDKDGASSDEDSDSDINTGLEKRLIPGLSKRLEREQNEREEDDLLNVLGFELPKQASDKDDNDDDDSEDEKLKQKAI